MTNPHGVAHPWELTREQWNAERDRLRPCFVQANFTKGSASEAVNRHERLVWLLGGVNDAARIRLKDFHDGKIILSDDELIELLDRVNTPIVYDDVVAHGDMLAIDAAMGAVGAGGGE